jgi:hypothetical protein
VTGNELINGHLKGGFRRLPVSLLQEGDEFLHRGSLCRGKLRNELTEICRTHVPPEQEKYTPAISRQQRDAYGGKGTIVEREYTEPERVAVTALEACLDAGRERRSLLVMNTAVVDRRSSFGDALATFT